MSKEEALNLKSFKHYCTCGGYAYTMNDRDPSSPHMSWCEQKDEYEEWYKAIHRKEEPKL
jgi:hypothetical protein